MTIRTDIAAPTAPRRNDRASKKDVLLDDAMPHWDVRTVHTLSISDAPRVLLTAAEDLTWREVPVFRILMTLRGLAGRAVRSDARVLDWFFCNGFRELGRTDQEMLVVSTQPTHRQLRAQAPPSVEAFREHREPGYIKIAFNFSVSNGFLSTETRVLTTDPRSRRLFAVYWLVIRAGSELIRRMWLRAIRARARRTRPEALSADRRSSTTASIVRRIDDRVVKRGMRLLLRLGLAPRAFALLETTGRRTGRPRSTPVGNGLVGETFWLIAARGETADYVKNLRAHPAVRIKIGRQWWPAVAEVLPDDDPSQRLDYILAHFGRLRRADAKAFEASIRLLDSTPRVVRIRLDRSTTEGENPCRA